jgi:ApbE superfamily uncharacterized protein (UPF0280 family)
VTTLPNQEAAAAAATATAAAATATAARKSSLNAQQQQLGQDSQLQSSLQKYLTMQRNQAAVFLQSATLLSAIIIISLLPLVTQTKTIVGCVFMFSYFFVCITNTAT